MYTAEDFKSDSPPARLMGSEMEFDTQYPTAQIAQLLDRGLPYLKTLGVYHFSQFFSNGSRIYPDIGHIEYATPECLGARQVTLAEEAGRRIVLGIVNHSQAVHRGVYDRVVAVNYADPKEETTTSGYHQNFCIPDDKEVVSRVLTHLPTFLATVPIWAGSGYIGHTGYQISQKASGIQTDGSISRALTREGQKPMIKITTDGASRGFIRCEVRAMDPSNSWVARRLSLAATSLCLRLLESPYFSKLEPLPRLVDPEGTIHLVSSDTELQNTYELSDDTRASASEIQLRFAEAALDLCNLSSLPEEEQEAASEWYELVKSLHTTPSDELALFADRIDWIARKAEMERRLGATGTRVLSPKAGMLDMLWDRIDKYRLGKVAFSKDFRGSDEAEASSLVTHAPRNTRAHTRATVILSNRAKISSMNWEMVAFQKGPGMPMPPYSTLMAESDEKAA